MIDDRYYQLYDSELRGETFLTFILLILVYEEKHDLLKLAHITCNFMEFKHSIERLEEMQLVKWHGEDPTEIMLRKKGEDLFNKYVGVKKVKIGVSEIKLWIDTWRCIFPPGVNEGGYRYRGDRAEVLKKMVKFVNDHRFTQEDIFKATENYVERFSIKGYKYMMLAHYFINKQNVGSTLAAECEGLQEDKPIKEEPGYGGQVV